ncbi:dTMP kinase [Stieleria sp. TO1_6]|uniref:dTMP kinase n=1 Tax=Stieleria tagensis TaxID=2956795 RepID=UPI00209BAE30|nr:dTMP kinase [Stieleria tagensis]MCO8120651.1 dTMP kinase [Stieleria tagensis]
MPKQPAHFIAIDGIDGVGKTTQIDGLADYLDSLGLSHVRTRDPGSSEIGAKLRELLLDSRLSMHRRTEAMLFMASRCEMVESTIKPTLAAGTSVISDRFLLANVVYQSVSETEQTISPELLWQMGDLANGGLRPNLTILLDMPAAAALQRIGRPADRMESRGAEYMEAVRQAYLTQLPSASRCTAVVNADQPLEQVQADLRAAVKSYLDGA